MVWSADPAVEANLLRTSTSGAVPRTKAPYASAYIVNFGANKLDYYVSGSMNWARTGCGSTRTVTVTITLRNDAPASGLPAYVTNRSDVHPSSVRPGDARDLLSYAATQGSLLDSASYDGKRATVAVGAERGHPVYYVDLELPRGTAHTLVLHLTEPQGDGPVRVLPQPLAKPWQITTSDASC
jgi:hypothetical protein